MAFIKIPSYFNWLGQSICKKIKRKGKQRLTLRRGRRPTPLAGPAHPRRRVVYLPAAPSCSVEEERGHGATSTPRGFQPPWTSSPRLGDRLEAPFHFPLSLDALPLFLSRISRSPRAAGARRRAQPRPTS